jgi:hypothetical protein
VSGNSGACRGKLAICSGKCGFIALLGAPSLGRGCPVSSPSICSRTEVWIRRSNDPYFCGPGHTGSSLEAQPMLASSSATSSCDFSSCRLVKRGRHQSKAESCSGHGRLFEQPPVARHLFLPSLIELLQHLFCAPQFIQHRTIESSHLAIHNLQSLVTCFFHR